MSDTITTTRTFKFIKPISVTMFKDGDVVRINYIGKIKETGEVFDTNLEEVAKKHGIYDPSYFYKPVPVLIGAHFIIPGLEEEVKKLKVGEKKTVTLPPEKAFGERNENYVKLISLNEFRKQGIVPQPGMEITVNGVKGRVLAIAGGRVRVDFNHPLAGKELEYEVEVVEKVEKPEEKVKAVVEYFFKVEEKDLKVEIDGKVAKVKLPNNLEVSVNAKAGVAETIKKWIENIEKVEFCQVY